MLLQAAESTSPPQLLAGACISLNGLSEQGPRGTRSNFRGVNRFDEKLLRLRSAPDLE